MTNQINEFMREYESARAEVVRLGLGDLLTNGNLEMVGCYNHGPHYLIPVINVGELVLPDMRVLESNRHKVMAVNNAVIKSGERGNPFSELFGFSEHGSQSEVETRKRHALDEYLMSKKEAAQGYPILPMSFLIHDGTSDEYFVVEERGKTLFSKIKNLGRLNREGSKHVGEEKDKIVDALHRFTHKQEELGIAYMPSYHKYKDLLSNLIIFDDKNGYNLLANDNPIFVKKRETGALRAFELGVLDYMEHSALAKK